jgi:hypothetical protein
MKALIPVDLIERKIYLIRGQKVMLDSDLAALYDVDTKILNKAVKRNEQRFPKDFMFRLTADETASLRFHFGTSNKGRGGRRYSPFAFTENGIAMLSSVLNSNRAIAVNIQIMRTFTKLRELLLTHKDLKHRLEDLEKKYDMQFKVVFDAIRQLMATPVPKEKKVGFIVKERSVVYRTKKKAAK